MRHYTANHLRLDTGGIPTSNLHDFQHFKYYQWQPKAFNVSSENCQGYMVHMFDSAGPRESLSLHSLTEHVGGRSTV